MRTATGIIWIFVLGMLANDVFFCPLHSVVYVAIIWFLIIAFVGLSYRRSLRRADRKDEESRMRRHVRSQERTQ
jgi:hypothetical protein